MKREDQPCDAGKDQKPTQKQRSNRRRGQRVSDQYHTQYGGKDTHNGAPSGTFLDVLSQLSYTHVNPPEQRVSLTDKSREARLKASPSYTGGVPLATPSL